MQQKSSRGVQQHEVEAAADALLAEGLRPTVERVRVKMGRGSPNTVAPMLEAWFAGLAPRLGVTPTEQGKPAGPPAAVRHGMQQLWEVALQLAREQAQAALIAERDALARDKESLAASRIEVAGQLFAASQHAEAMQAAVDHARAEVESCMERERQAQTLLQQRDRELTDARASIVQLVAQKDAAAKDHADHLKRLESERTKNQERAAATERRLLEEVDRARQESKSALKTADDWKSRAGVLQQEAASTRESLRSEIHRLEVERAQLVERLAAVAVRPIKSAVGPKRKATAAKIPKPRGRRVAS